MNESSAGPTEPGYSEWQRLLAEAFFGRRDVPVVILAADDELERIVTARQGSTAAASLAHAVRQFARLEDGVNMFAGLRGPRMAWRTDMAGPPPTLPLLALTVLAATRMRRDDEATSANYYLRMAQVLQPGGDPAEIRDVRSHLPGAFEHDVTPMWRELHDWMSRCNGDFGLSTVRAHPYLTNIGYPLSQALVRASDKALLTRFFAAIDVVRCGVPAEGALLAYLRLWALRHRTLSDTMRSALDDDSLSAMIGPIVSGLAASWDGKVMTLEGRRRLEVRLVLSLEDWQGRWVLAGAGRGGVLTLSGKVDGTACVAKARPAAFGGYASLDGVPAPTGDLVAGGFKLDGAGVSAEFLGVRLAAMRQDADAGGWISCDGVEPYSDHILAVHPDLTSTVKDVLNEAADAGWRALPQVPNEPLLPGYSVFRKVRFSDRGRLEDALASLPGSAKRVLRPVMTARPRLAAGLPLVRSVAAGCYLAGGEPDLLLPVADEAREVTVVFDGASQAFTASGFPIPLSVLPGIEPGWHEVDADGESLRFMVLDRSPAGGPATGTGSLAWDPLAGALGPADGSVGVCGPLAPDCPADAEPLLVRRGATESWWMHSDGCCTASSEPAQAAFLESLGLRSLFYEADPPTTAAWLVQKRHQGWAAPILLRRLAPEFRRLGAEACTVWSALTEPTPIQPSEAEAGLWALYLRAWRLARGR